MERCTRSSWTRPSKKVEVFMLFPCGGLVAGVAVFLLPGLEAPELAPLQAQEVLDENIAELLAEERVVLQRVERLAQAARQHRTRRRIRLVVARPGLQGALDALEPRYDL